VLKDAETLLSLFTRPPVHRCAVPGCSFAGKDDNQLLDHGTAAHGHRQRYAQHPLQLCGIGGCRYASRYTGNLKKHRTRVHGSGESREVQELKRLREAQQKRERLLRQPYEVCAVDGCNYSSNHKGALKQHKAAIHDIGVCWWHCAVEGCPYKAKQKSNLKRHTRAVHNAELS
jgi:hypothetical protein